MSQDTSKTETTLKFYNEGQEVIRVYNIPNQTLEQIKELAERMWEGCHGCDEMDKYMWTGGFIEGYLMAQSG